MKQFLPLRKIYAEAKIFLFFCKNVTHQGIVSGNLGKIG